MITLGDGGPGRGVVVAKKMGTSPLNPGAEFLRIFTVAFDRLG